MDTERKEILQRFLQTYADENHEEWISLLSIVVAGPQDDIPLTVRLVAMIGLKRIGAGEEALNVLEQAFSQVPEGAKDPFIERLVQMIFGKATLPEVLAVAEYDTSRCAAHYYAGAVAATVGDHATAQTEFQACVEMDVDSLEKDLAKHHLEKARATTALQNSQGLIDAFVKRDYHLVVDLAVEHGKREENLTLEGVLVLLISNQRLGRSDLHPKRDRPADQDPSWVTVMLDLVNGWVDVAEASARAGDSRQRCQAYFYSGARLRTLGQDEEARAALNTCLETNVDCPERIMAQAELASLDDWA